MKRYRVVVTGMGVVSPIGEDIETFAKNLFAGHSGVGPLTHFDGASLRTRIAAEVKNCGRATDQVRDRKILYALEAARQAMDACQGNQGPGLEEQGRNAAVSLGLGLELFAMEDLFALKRAANFELPKDLEARARFLQTPSDLCLHSISWCHGLQQAPLAHVSACAAGTDALGQAFRLVASGRRRWMLAGGTDSMLNPLGMGGFCKLEAMSTRNDEPSKASRPFDKDRDGFVLGEGAGMLVFERLEDANKRGAPIFAEILGYGNSFDAHGISEPHPQGRGATLAMKRALDDAKSRTIDVDFINAHGTSTPKNDPTETLAIKTLLGKDAKNVPVISTKSMMGHLIAAAGAVEAIATILCLREQCLHPTINCVNPDPLCDLDYVTTKARYFPIDLALSNSFGFGGQNASIVLKMMG